MSFPYPSTYQVPSYQVELIIQEGLWSTCLIKILKNFRNSLVVQWSGLKYLCVKGPGFNPGLGIRIHSHKLHGMAKEKFSKLQHLH